MKILKYLQPVCIALIIAGCTSYYEKDDFSKVKKIDAHVHLRTENTTLIDMAEKYNFKLITINTESSNPASQEEMALSLVEKYPEQIYFLGYFPTDDINEPGWEEKTIDIIKKNMENGALGIKIWKNIGMTIKDQDSNYIMADDPVFNKIFSYMASNNIPLLAHLGEPKYCWQPLEEMTFGKGYYTRNPQYHMYNNDEVPHYDEQIKAMDNLVEKNPELTYVGAHLASLEWSVDEVAKRLDKYPNMYVDLAARTGCVQLQARDNRERVRDFFINYYDRILYGSDFVTADSRDESFYNWCNNTWLNDWEFFTTDGTFERDEFKGYFKGLKLPKKVIDHIYYKNAYRIFIKN